MNNLEEIVEIIENVENNQVAELEDIIDSVQGFGTIKRYYNLANKRLAQKIYNAGYRQSAVLIKTIKDEVRKETAVNIFNRIAEYAIACQEAGYDGLGVEDIKELAAEYGVEEEE